MSRRGRRFETEPHLNYKKVFGLLVVVLLIIGVIFAIKYLVTKGKETGKITSASYYALYTDNKWGIIDNNGNEIIPPSYQEMLIVPNSKKDVFLCTYDLNAETGEYKTKALNSKNEEIFTEYTQVEAIQNVDKNNNLWYEENVLRVQKNEKYGLIDLSGNEILSCEYTSIMAVAGVKNSLKIDKEGQCGLATSEGKIIIEPTLTSVESLGNDYKEGYITIDSEGKYGVVDYLGKQLLENNYEKVEQIYGKEHFVVTEKGNQKLVNSAGEVLIEKGIDEIVQILEDTEQGVIFKKKDTYGIMNFEGEVVLKNEYDDLKKAKDGFYIAKKDDKYGIITVDGEEKVDYTYASISYNQTADIYTANDDEANTTILNGELETKLKGILSEVNNEKGYLKIKIDGEYKYYNFKFEEKDNRYIMPNNTLYLTKENGKYGFVSVKGDIVVDCIYDDATEQNEEGFAAIKKDGKWGSIDLNGKIIVEPTYNLDSNYLIDFIGKWHLGQDINMNYYCDK